VWELPPNTQGVTALQMLNLLEGYDIKSMGFGSADYLHVFIEAKKLAFEDRARFYADPEFAKIPLKALLSKEYAAKRRGLIDLKKAALEYPVDPKALDQSDTIYMTVADAAGNMISLIQSNYRGLGSGMTPDGCGFILHDRGELFSLTPGHANVYEPANGRSTPSSRVHHQGWQALAVIRRDGRRMQPQGHVQIVVNLIDFGMNLQEAGDAPRARHEGSSEPTDERMRDGGRSSWRPGSRPRWSRPCRRAATRSLSRTTASSAVTRPFCARGRGVFRGV
jgi:gamma-glutamyltranspeptidase/glutathione hydrolase